MFDSYMCFPYILHVCNTLSDEAHSAKALNYLSTLELAGTCSHEARVKPATRTWYYL